MLEKDRILVLAFILFVFFIAVSIIDGWFTMTVFGIGFEDWTFNRTWVLAMYLIFLMASVGMGVGSLMGDWGLWSLEDYVALILLAVQPFILVFGGFLDLISKCVQDYVRSGEPLRHVGNLANTWTWIDPPRTYGVPMFSYFFSRVLGYEGTVTLGVIIGSVFSITVVVVLWLIYYEHA